MSYYRCCRCREQALPLPVESGQDHFMGRLLKPLVGLLLAAFAIVGGLFHAFGFMADVVSAPEDARSIGAAIASVVRKFADAPDWAIYPLLLAILLVGLALLFGWHPEKGWVWTLGAPKAGQGPALPATALPQPPAPTTSFTTRVAATPMDNVVDGRALDEPGVTIGPMPTAEALAVLARPEQEYIPLNEAGQWLYDNAEPWLREHLKNPAPFDSITEHAAAFVGEACDAGSGELVARRESGLKPERIRFHELRHTGLDAVFGGGQALPVDPAVRRADLPAILGYYRNPQTTPQSQHVVVKRDTPLREALMFAATGQWDLDPMKDGGDRLAALGAATHHFKQLAHDGAFTVWGKAGNHSVWQRIEPKYWIDHYVDLLDVLRAETRTRAYNQMSQEPLFQELMVCRTEFEAGWSDT
jgi:hypothetical protein